MENEKMQPLPERTAEELLEEEEMERFFALVRSFKEMRDQRWKELNMGEEEEEKRRKRMKAGKMVENRSTWIPKFEREDFDEEFQALSLPEPCCNLDKRDTRAAATTTTTTAAMKNKKRVKNGEVSLDLNLAL
uniref:Protein NIM1-INTERACTING 1 n=1 Tax=Cucumis melo TaxID=3656 RepID=A0A9I9DTN8_CUCME